MNTQPEDENPVELEAQWAEIVAHWDSPLPELDAARESTVPAEDQPDDGWRGSGRSLLDDVEEPFQPPLREQPPPLSWVGVLAGIATIAGPALLLLFAAVWPQAPQIAVVAALLVSIVGFGVLVVRLPQERDEDDDGAAV